MENPSKSAAAAPALGHLGAPHERISDSIARSAAAAMTRLKLARRDEWAGWIPYGWLCLFGFFFFNNTAGPFPPLWWLPALAGTALFLLLYFKAYNLTCHEATAKLPWLACGVALLGYVFLLVPPYNGYIFVMYAAVLCGIDARTRVALMMILAVIGAFFLEGSVAHHYLRISQGGWTYGSLSALLVGVSNLHFTDIARRNRALKRSQEEVRRLAAIAERERIARDLHDLLGHTLTLITVKSELAARLAESDMPGAACEIRQVECISRDALRHVREAVGGYRGRGLAAETVNARIALSAANISLKACETGSGLPEEHEQLLALTLREAVTNIVRHSGAHECQVSLCCTGSEAHLSVRDDGRGGSIKEGNGLRGMRERLQSLGGRLAVESSPAGTCVHASVPLASPAPACLAGAAS